MRQLNHAVGTQRSQFGRFHNHRIARCQSRCHFPCKHLRGEVPRQHYADHADRLMHNQTQCVVAGGGDAAKGFIHIFSIEIKGLNGGGHIGVDALTDGFARVDTV